ncbi:glycosyltransferase family 4 protein [Candidatus Parcubacteria bacterium]|nr:glycosyltransferase family 4 protein [Candidatus Parcubacteria bacterium]
MNLNKIPKGIRSALPYSLKRFLVRQYVRWNMRKSPGSLDAPRISFASILPSQGSFIRGGKVKLTYLRKRFGEFATGYNILYLVSSTLPGFADIWVDEAKRKGIKVVWNQNGVGYPAWTSDWKKVNDLMKPITKADYVIYQSDFCRKECDEMVAKYNGPQTVLVNCVDTDKATPANPPLPLDPLNLLITGTHMTPEKVLLPLDAMRILLDRGMNVRALVYGPSDWPNADSDIEAKIAELKLEGLVEVHGKYLHDDSSAIYKRGHIFLHLKYMDPSPNTVLSAMSSGLPVVGSKSGGTVELVPPSAGILLDVPISHEALHYPSPEEVANAVETISKDWSAYSQSARAQAVAELSVAHWLKAHEEIFKSVLKHE